MILQSIALTITPRGHPQVDELGNIYIYIYIYMCVCICKTGFNIIIIYTNYDITLMLVQIEQQLLADNVFIRLWPLGSGRVFGTDASSLLTQSMPTISYDFDLFNLKHYILAYYLHFFGLLSSSLSLRLSQCFDRYMLQLFSSGWNVGLNLLFHLLG